MAVAFYFYPGCCHSGNIGRYGHHCRSGIGCIAGQSKWKGKTPIYGQQYIHTVAVGAVEARPVDHLRATCCPCDIGIRA